MTAPVAAPAASPPGGAPGLPARPGPKSHVMPDAPSPRFRGWSVPMRLRLWTAAALALIAALLVTLVSGVSDARGDLHTVGRDTAPQAATAAELYYSLADMDAQVANVLLIGHEEEIGNKQSALRQLRRDRAAVSAAIQKLVDGGLSGDGDEVARALLADLATYDSLTGQARLADDQVVDRVSVGRPPALAINFYLTATALLHQDMLPAADRLGADAEAGLSASTRDGRDSARTAALVVLALGVAAVAVLVGFQIVLARRFRRIVNPALAAVTLAVAIVTGLGAGLLNDHGERLRDAKTESFDPFGTLARTRAIASDANADESRYLILPDRADYYRAQFSDKVAVLEGASGNQELVRRLAAFRRDDTALVAAVRGGDRAAAIGMATNVGRGNLAFEFFDYQDTLDDFASTYHADFSRRVDDAEDALSGWDVLPPVVLGAGILLVLVAVRPRLREYRRR
ncbi:hypothetical protein LO772_27770 [Yinghuangia sp. ASG 101]|uniref:hypothetical protein n=1 Tax=Yinghuangia sp. ASG 101 TaxID=2896848 RepID=UPI001E4AA274|nr:hypothetical protein [Yinghuangia sp. ASG 101]UGQ10605.1 hypothetical protein LO772_27770 [Yinghuangia sp. ASG 101]